MSEFWSTLVQGITMNEDIQPSEYFHPVNHSDLDPSISKIEPTQ